MSRTGRASTSIHDKLARCKTTRREPRSVRILIVATKPPHPPRDGGRLALWHTLCGLSDAGHELAVVAPAGECDHSRKADGAIRLPYHFHAVDARPRGAFAAATHALIDGHSLAVARHALVRVRDAVADTLAQWQPHVVHAEQLHAFANCEAATDAAVPIVLRMQNVESAIRMQQARLGMPWLRIEAARLRRDEGAMIAKASRIVALCDGDAAALRAARPGTAVASIAPPFPAALAPAPMLDGDPAIALAGSAGWWPNADGERWLLQRVWPLVAKALPRAILHRFGGASTQARERIRQHPAPVDSRAAFPAGAIAVVPLRVGSGIRMRILEAWARGLPVVATPAAARGLAVASGDELIVADTPAAFADAILRIHADAALRDTLVAGGSRYLRRHHDGACQTRALLDAYDDACGRP
jgi:hypothetical protein